MPKKRASGENIVTYFEDLEHFTGTAEERVAQTALHFGIKHTAVHQQLKFWWSGKKYLEVFGPRKTRIKWDRPTEELLNALNVQGSVSKAAQTLGTTSVTLMKAIVRHGIVQRWVEDSEEGGSKVTRRRRGRPRRKPQTKYLWAE